MVNLRESGVWQVATTFINKQCPEMILLDLKYLLQEAKQRVPPVRPPAVERIVQEKGVNLKLDGDENHFTNALLSLIKIMLCKT